MGYHRAGFEVVGVDIAPQKNYPFEFYQADAMTFPLEGFDVVHASPPCQGYTRLNHPQKANRPRLVGAVRQMLSGKVVVIENVVGAPLRDPLMLCGTALGLGVIRHRLFEISVTMPPAPDCDHRGTVADGTYSGVRNGGPRSTHTIPYAEQRARWEHDMGIDWPMTRRELAEAIPPAYTEWIGRQLIDRLEFHDG